MSEKTLPLPARKNRIPHIDLIESIAIFFVVICHCTLFEHDIIAKPDLTVYANYFFRTILSVCVPLFFFCNGYLLFNRPFNLKKHVFKTIRMVGLVFVWMAISMPLFLLIAGKRITLKAMLMPILNMEPEWSMNLFWFMGALVCVYIIFPALKALFDSNKKALLFFAIACAVLTLGYNLVSELLAVAGWLSHRWLGNMSYAVFTVFNPFRGSYGYAFVYFCAGGLIYSYEDKIRSLPRLRRNLISAAAILVSCACLFLTGVFYSKRSGETWNHVWNGYETVYAFCGVIGIYTLSLEYKRNLRLFTVISANTLGIYFIHNLFIRLTFPHLEKIEFMQNIPINLVYAAVILAASLCAVLLLKKIPLLKKLV